jgi:hypothetical protein
MAADDNELECPLLTRNARLGRGLSADVGVEVI